LKTTFVQGLQGLYTLHHDQEGQDLPRPVLPPYLTEFCSTYIDDPDTEVPFLPEKSLRVLKLGFVMLEREKIVWPSSITSFDSTVAELHTAWYDPETPLTIEALEQQRADWSASEGDLVLVPNSAIDLTLHVENTILLTYLLPSKLTRLSLRINRERTCEEKMFPLGWSRFLPSTLLHLELEQIEVCRDFFEYQRIPLLQTLAISSFSNFQLSELLLLPQISSVKLSFLDLLDWQSVNLSSLKELRHMDIRTRGDLICPDFNWIPFLPPKLIEFTLTGRRIHPLSMDNHLDAFKRARIAFRE
jgi:hypothetical protein